MAGEVIRVKGLQEAVAKLNGAKIAGKPARNFLNRWALFTEREGKQNAPVWRGQLRRSITHELDHDAFPKSARVGTNAPHGPYMEHGTGLLSDAPGGGGRHFPPPAALDAWAIDHGFRPGSRKSAQADAANAPGTYGLLVSQIIWKRGGLKPRRYLRKAAEASAGQVPGWLTQMAEEIEGQAASA